MALQDFKPLVQGRREVLSTNDESVYKKLTRQNFEPKKLMNESVSRGVGWLVEDYPSSQVTVRYVPG